MIENILKALKAADIEEYRINEVKSESAELFFVKKRLDMRRSAVLSKYKVTVFNSFDKEGKAMKGSADVLVSPGSSEAELKAKFADAYRAAGFICNPAYKFSKPECAKLIKRLPNLEEGVKYMTEALFEADTREDVFLNSAELFVIREEVRVLASNGTDVAFNRYLVKGEFVAQCKEPQDVETYMDFSYRSLEIGALTELVKEVLDTTKARAIAKEAPKAGKYRVIISGRYAESLFNFYKDRSQSSFVYAGYSNNKVGDKLQGENIKGDAINMTLKASSPFSMEGIAMKDRTLLEDGKLQLLHGGERFADYLGIEATGDYSEIEVKPGNTTLEEMKSEPYLNVVNFSDFQTDALNGHFGGEIRLAFYFDGEKEIPVTGGSVSGNLFELQENMVFSTKTQKRMNYTGPVAVCFDKVNVAGR